MTDPLETMTWAGHVAAVLHLLIIFAVSIRVLTRRRPPAGGTMGATLRLSAFDRKPVPVGQSVVVGALVALSSCLIQSRRWDSHLESVG